MKEDADKDKGEDAKLWGVFLFGLIGASATTLAVSLSALLFFDLFFSIDLRFMLRRIYIRIALCLDYNFILI